jgi:alpha-ketoglutarate-dependent taurine dioxygenase
MRDGWSISSAGPISRERLVEQMLTLARSLGEVVAGRNKHLVEPVIPRPVDAAFPASLSSVYGLGTLPMHTDTAHWSTPCRYLVMACAEPGPQPTPTLLMDSNRVELSDQERLAMLRAVFLIRNGHRSFYGYVKDSSREFLRLDPGCMAPVCSEGAAVLRVFERDRQRHLLQRHDWKLGDILIIDNWRMLHGRGDGEQTSPGRVLLRTMVQ